ncbi:MAG: sugar phosphate isomerase/epimerase [Phycisphaeraceae bacterium]
MNHSASSQPRFPLTIFTKPWKAALSALGPFVRGLGVDGIELPVRPGFQVEPAEAPQLRRAMGQAVRVLGQSGVQIRSVATDQPTPALIEVCGEIGVPLIRALAPIPHHQNFWEAVEDMQRRWDRLVPSLARHGVALGIQNHCDRYLTNAMHLWFAINRYDPKQVTAVWDPAHNALQGEDLELALDILGTHLGMVSLKNALRRRRPQAHPRHGAWETYWTRGHEGLADWRGIATELRRRGWSGNVCLHAEYSEEHRVDELIADDLTYARAIFADAATTPHVPPAQRPGEPVIVVNHIATPSAAKV